MSNFLYNGVELPGLPETWNEAAHPHLFIRVVSLDGSAENAVYSLFAASAAAVSYDDNGILFPSSAVGEKYAVSDGAWVESSESLSDAFYIKRNDGFLYTLWANFDILNSDGSVYIAASEPVPVVEKFPIREWIGWLLAGLCSRPLPMGAREPVAYLYNGVRLPGLPSEWNPETHPHAYITQTLGRGDYSLYFTDTPLNATYYPADSASSGVESLSGVNSDGISVNYKLYVYSSEAEQWEYRRDSSLVFQQVYVPMWANTDMEKYYYYYDSETSTGNYEATGTVGFSASDPVPVYE